MGTNTQGPQNETERLLRTIRPQRGVYTAEQVTAIREMYLLEGLELAEIRERMWPKTSINNLWRIAIGRSYPEVPLSAALRSAYERTDALRKAGLPRRQE